MTTTSQNSPWALKKKVLVHAPEFDVSCPVRLRVAHDRTAKQGSISLSIIADLADFSNRSQVHLNLRPEIINNCVATKSNDKLIPSSLISLLPVTVLNTSEAFTLILHLDEPGVVLCPSKTDYIRPANPEDTNLLSFSKICQSTVLHLHLCRRQFVDNQLDLLYNFSYALKARNLRQSKAFYDTSHDLFERHCRVFDLSFDLPPCYVEPTPSYTSTKRRREPSSPDNATKKRALLPSFQQLDQKLDSPTEVNTPSTPSLSPRSICPSHFTHRLSPSSNKHDVVMRLKRELHGISDELVRKLLVESGRQHLLAIPEDINSDLPTKSEKISVAEVDKMIECRLNQFIEERLTCCVNEFLNEHLDGIAEDYRDKLYADNKMHEDEFYERVDDINSEVRNTANECMQEMEELAQRCMDKIEDQGTKYTVSKKKEVDKLKLLPKGLVHPFIDGKACLIFDPGTHARRSSI
ncbi:hypothetical protein N7495_001980 [Penicillium taxi]|uniref:uncharacterized protein n=1 Tax=Penicillium taxi TaxID=168475 RepID=UPI0025456767|nr:uncharacterized protein N7495_001980 [Penicillium taxi]KAJ5901452.1 hypothetical protein N7495_001980 [Penicillium taxi]